MTQEELLQKLKELQDPKTIDPYWADDPGWIFCYLESLIIQLEDEGIT